LAGSLVGVVVVSLAWKATPPTPPAVQPSPIAPVTLAEHLIARTPDLLVLDLRSLKPEGDLGIPGAVVVDSASGMELLGRTNAGVRVVLVTADSTPVIVPVGWPADRDYLVLAGGYTAWTTDVLTPTEPADGSVAEQGRVVRQHQLAAYFSGAAVQSASAATPPPVLPAGGGAKKKRAGGC
jgi:hypothetical protein